ncbi:MAG: hypothetical protein ACPG5P_00950, partial [Saprospiraceae bacterium]
KTEFQMKKVILILINFIFIVNIYAQSVEGTWYYPEQEITVVFHPMKDHTRNYQFIFSNGAIQQSTYWTMGSTLYIKEYNNGMDESFEIVGLTANYLEIRQQMNENAAVMRFVKKGSVAEKIMDTKNKVIIPYNLNDTKILFTENGINYTQGHFNIGRWFGEFLIARELTSSEIKIAQQEAYSEFKKNPEQTLMNLEQIKQSMEQIFDLKDVLQIAVTRNMFLAGVHQSGGKPENSLLIKLIQEEVNVLLVDKTNNMVLTEQDLEWIIEFAEFTSALSGENEKISSADKKKILEDLKKSYPSASLEEKQTLAVLASYSKIIENNYHTFDATQKEQFREMITGKDQQKQSSQGNDSKMDWNTYNAMSNMSLSNHATMMNSIEAIGGTGNYWYVK